MPLKLIKRYRRAAVSILFPTRHLRGNRIESSKKFLFKWPWCHFLDVSHSSGRAFSACFRGCRRSWRGAFAIGLTVDDELMSAMAEAIESALAKQRFVKDGHPFLHA